MKFIVQITPHSPTASLTPVYTQEFDDLDVPEVVMFLNDLKPIPKPRAERSDKGKKRTSNPTPTVESLL